MPHRDPTPDLDAVTCRARTAEDRTARADRAVATAVADPAITGQPDPDRLLAVARTRWQSDRDTEQARKLHQELARARAERHQQIASQRVPYQPAPARHGPSIGI